MAMQCSRRRGLPITQHVELWDLVFHQRFQKALREAEVPLESRATMELPSLLNEGTGPTTLCNYLVNSHVRSQTHRPGSRTEQIYHHSHLCNTSCLRQLSPAGAPELGLFLCGSTMTASTIRKGPSKMCTEMPCPSSMVLPSHSVSGGCEKIESMISNSEVFEQLVICINV